MFVLFRYIHQDIKMIEKAETRRRLGANVTLMCTNDLTHFIGTQLKEVETALRFIASIYIRI